MTSSHTATRTARAVAAETGEPTVSEGKYSTWFGPESAPLFGTVHVPADSRARGAVVLCPPLGKEAVDSYRGMALLAQKLCATGLLVLRFDYRGTGDSGGEQDSADIVRQWTESVTTAVDYVRSCGAEHVGIVGLRAGALLGAAVASQCGPLAALALWDPVVRGRSYLHEQRALYSVSVTKDAEADPRVSIIGAVLHPTVSAGLAALDTTKAPSFGCPVLVATRPERADAKPIRTVVNTQGADEHSLKHHDLFLEPTDFEVVIPTADIDAIASWVDTQFDGRSSSVSVSPHTVTTLPTVTTVVYETIEQLGPDSLFAIRTSSDACTSGGPTVVLYSTANEHRVGPVRLWVELARHLAAQGVTVVRFDRRGTGESGAVLDDEITKLYSDEGNADALAAVRYAGASPQNVLVSGMCSGSWYSSYAARELGVNSAVLLNTLDWTTRRLEFVKRSSMHNEDSSRISAALDRLHNVGVTVKNGLQSSLPYPLWFWLGTRGLIQVPEISLGKLAAKKVRTTVLLSPNDSAWFVANRGPEGMNRLRRGRRKVDASSTVVKSYLGGDHSLYGRDLRENVREELLRAVSTAFDVEIAAPAPPVPVEWTPL